MPKLIIFNSLNAGSSMVNPQKTHLEKYNQFIMRGLKVFLQTISFSVCKIYRQEKIFLSPGPVPKAKLFYKYVYPDGKPYYY